MTAPIVTRSIESAVSVEPLLGNRPPLPIASRTPRSGNRGSTPRKAMSGSLNRDRFSSSFVNSHSDLHQLWSRLLELLPQGVIVVSRSLKPVYWNQKAKQLCQALVGAGLNEDVLPLAVTEACYSLLRDNLLRPASLMMEYQTSKGHLMRIRTQVLESTNIPIESAHPLPGLPTQPVPTFIAVFIENCDEILQQEAWIQQQKYDLTDRETEIWMLLRQELTYQEIAQTLQISLNTVKTHVKNVYAKRRSCQGKEKFWC